MSSSATTETPASLVGQASSACFDLLAVLITNDEFIRSATPSLFARLLRVSRHTRAILNTGRTWECALPAWLQVTAGFLFDGVDPSISRLKVLYGLCRYIFRRDRQQPADASVLEKENELWSEVYRDTTLYRRVLRYCQVTDPSFQFPRTQDPSSPARLSVEEMARIAEGESFDICSPVEITFGSSYVKIRHSGIQGHDVYLSKLLPFDIPEMDITSEKQLTIANMSFLKVSGWHKVLSAFTKLTITKDWPLTGPSFDDPLASLQGMPKVLPLLRFLHLGGSTDLTSLRGMPEMPRLEQLYLPESIESLEGMPKELPSLTEFGIEWSLKLKSLRGMPEMPKLAELFLSTSIETLEGMPRELPLLECFSVHRHGRLTSPQGMSAMPNLTMLQLPESIETLEGMPAALGSLRTFRVRHCTQLTSLRGMPEMPKLLEMDLPVGVETLMGIPEELPSLTKLTISSHRQHIISQLPRMPKLDHLVLTKYFVNLADLRINQSTLRVLDLRQCCKLSSLDDMASFPGLEILRIPSSIRTIRGLAAKLPSLKSLYLESKLPRDGDERSQVAAMYKRASYSLSLWWRIASWTLELPAGCCVAFYEDKLNRG